MKKLFFAAIIFLVALTFGASSVMAATVTVTEIKASGSGGKVTVDPKLDDIKDKLPSQFSFSNYDWLASKSQDVSTGTTATFNLVTGATLQITVDSATDKEITYTLNAASETGEQVMKTQVVRSRGDWYLLVMGESKKIDGTLILAIKAE